MTSDNQPNTATDAWKVSRLLDLNHVPELDEMNATCQICGYLAESTSEEDHRHLINPENIIEANAWIESHKAE